MHIPASSALLLCPKFSPHLASLSFRLRENDLADPIVSDSHLEKGGLLAYRQVFLHELTWKFPKGILLLPEDMLCEKSRLF